MGNNINIRLFLLTIGSSCFCSLLLAQSVSKKNCKISGNKYTFYLYEAIEPADTSYGNYTQALIKNYDSTSIWFEKKYFQVSTNALKVTGKYKIRFYRDSCLLYLIVKPRVKHMFESNDDEKMRMRSILSGICRNTIKIEKDILIVSYSTGRYNPVTGGYDYYSHRFLFKR